MTRITLLLAALASCVASNIEQAKRALNRGEYKKAQVLLDEHLEEHPRDGWARTGLAKAYLGQGFQGDALYSFDRALELNVGLDRQMRARLGPLYLARARQRLAFGDWSAVISDVRRARQFGVSKGLPVTKARNALALWRLRRGMPADLTAAQKLLTANGQHRWAQALARGSQPPAGLLAWLWRHGARKVAWKLQTSSGAELGEPSVVGYKIHRWWSGPGVSLPTQWNDVVSTEVGPCFVATDIAQCEPQSVAIGQLGHLFWRARHLGWWDTRQTNRAIWLLASSIAHQSYPAPGQLIVEEAGHLVSGIPDDASSRRRMIEQSNLSDQAKAQLRQQVDLWHNLARRDIDQVSTGGGFRMPVPIEPHQPPSNALLLTPSRLLAAYEAIKRDDVDEAISNMEIAEKQSPGDPRVLYTYGLLIAESRPGYALQLLTEAAALSGDAGVYAEGACLVLQAQGTSLLAVKMGEIAVQLLPSPRKQLAVRCVADALWNMGRGDNAKALLTHYKIKPTPGNQLARIVFWLSRWTPAASHLAQQVSDEALKAKLFSRFPELQTAPSKTSPGP